MSRRIAALLIAAALLAGCSPTAPAVPAASTAPASPASPAPGSSAVPATPAASDQALAAAYEGHLEGLQVAGSGTVIRVLSDDSDGGRHQRFILELASGQTLLVAHNIDVAPRIPTLLEGDVVEFNGVYEWNDQGGVIHWTHHDPQGVHEDGWLRHKGAVYQ